MESEQKEMRHAGAESEHSRSGARSKRNDPSTDTSYEREKEKEHPESLHERRKEREIEIIPRAKEKKMLPLLLFGAELTDNLIQEEISKRVIEISEEKEAATGGATKAVAEAATEGAPAEAAEVEDKAAEVEEVKEEVLTAVETPTTPVLPEKSSTAAEATPEYEIVKGVVKGKVAAWNEAMDVSIRQKVFNNSKPPIKHADLLKQKQKQKQKQEKQEKQVVPTATPQPVTATPQPVAPAANARTATTPAVSTTAPSSSTTAVTTTLAPATATPASSTATPATTAPSNAIKIPSTTTAPSAAIESSKQQLRPSILIYTKHELLLIKEASPLTDVSLDKSILGRSSGFAKKKRDFKLFAGRNPFSSQGKKTEAYTFSAIETYLADFNLALNQLSDGNIEEVAKRVLKIKVPTNEAMKELTKALFDRAMQQEAYASLYARLVQLIQKKFRSAEEEEYNEEKYNREKKADKAVRENRSIFGIEVANLTRKEFITHREWASAKEDLSGSMNMSAEELARRVLKISEDKEKEYERMSVKKRALAIIRFVAELFLHGFFSAKLVHHAVTSLMKNSSPENVERLCYLLRHTGVCLDNPSSSRYIDQYVEWLESASNGLSPRYYFMIQDLKDLRANAWVDTKKKPSEAAQEEKDEDEWKLTKTRDRKRGSISSSSQPASGKPLFSRRDSQSQQPPQALQQSLQQQIQQHPRVYSQMESAISEVLRGVLPVREEAKRLFSDYSDNALFLAAAVKMTAEAYGEQLDRGFLFLQEWKGMNAPGLARREDVLSYIEETMPDIADDSPNAPKHLERIKSII